MSEFRSLGLSRIHLHNDGNTSPIELVLIHRPLDRILAYVGFTIDDVVNNPIAKNAVLGYYKLHRQIERRSEIVDLERQWNPI
jgi:hypothetical protein